MNTLDKNSLLKRASWASVIVSILLVIIKIFAWWLTESLGLLASLMDSFTDVLASGLNFFAVRYALLDADENHNFGHGKASDLSALIQAMFIAGSSIFLLINALDRLFHQEAIKRSEVGIWVMVISLFLTILLVIYQTMILRKVNSLTVRADFLNYYGDILTSSGIIIALVLTEFGLIWADGVIAILVVIFMLINAGKILKESISALMDTALPFDEICQIKSAINSVKGHTGVHRLRARKTGNWRLIDMHLTFDDQISLYKAHTINDEIEKAIASLFDDPTEIMIHLEPESVALNDLYKLGK